FEIGEPNAVPGASSHEELWFLSGPAGSRPRCLSSTERWALFDPDDDALERPVERPERDSILQFAHCLRQHVPPAVDRRLAALLRPRVQNRDSAGGRLSVARSQRRFSARIPVTLSPPQSRACVACLFGSFRAGKKGRRG